MSDAINVYKLSKLPTEQRVICNKLIDELLEKGHNASNICMSTLCLMGILVSWEEFEIIHKAEERKNKIDLILKK